MKNDSVQQRPAILPVRWVHQHPRRFVYDNDLVIFKYNIERNIFWPHGGAARMVDYYLDKIVRTEFIASIFRTPVDLASLRFYQIAQIHFAQAVEMHEQKVFEPHLVMLRCGQYFDTVFHP